MHHTCRKDDSPKAAPSDFLAERGAPLDSSGAGPLGNMRNERVGPHKAAKNTKPGRHSQIYHKNNKNTANLILDLLILGTSLCLLLGGHGAAEAQAAAPAAAKPAPQVQQEASLSLGSILEHQASLVDQCRRLEAQTVEQLRSLIEFEKTNGVQLDLEGRHSIRLPAVCLFLNGAPEQQGGPAWPANRLDLVNWIFEPEQLDSMGLGSGKNGSSGLLNRRARESGQGEQAADNVGSFPVSDYLFNSIGQPDEGQWSAGSLEEEKEAQMFSQQYGKLMQDERYQSALDQISKRVEPYLSPVVLVPGLAGSRLQARFKKQYRVNIFCPKQSDWQEFWLSLKWFLPIAIDCWIDNARLVYDPNTGFAAEPPGVESRVPDFGSVDSVSHLDLGSPKLTKYFDSIIQRYKMLGYQDGKTLFAAPYDFRLAPQQLEATFFPQLRQLIEAAQLANSNSLAPSHKVTLVCHSMGCTNLLIFLRKQSPQWRAANVRKVIAISSPWGGSIKALKGLLVGEQFGLPLVSETKLRDLARTFPSVAYLLPQAEIFDRPNKYQVDTATGGPVVVQTPEKSYTVAQMQQLLEDVQLQLQWNWFKTTTEPLKPLEPLPDVQMDCIHSINIPTVETVLFRNQTDFPNGNYELIYGDGDGTVNHQSLFVCADWAAALPGKVRHKVVKNTSHMGTLSNKLVLDHITSDIIMKS